MPTPKLEIKSNSSSSDETRIDLIKHELKLKQNKKSSTNDDQSDELINNNDGFENNNDDVDNFKTDVITNDNIKSTNSSHDNTSTNNIKINDFFTKTYRNKVSSFLKPSSSFIGSQQSGRSTYEVRVDLKEVDLKRSYLCGFLTIHGLTETHPQITTFFKGEIIGPHHSFYTLNESWGSNKRNDLQHWGRFPSWRSLEFNPDNDLDNLDIYNNSLNNEFLYMRWKEVFLVPDAKVKDIRGASFAGFYYVCFNQLTGYISGLYFHKCSDKFQQLELAHVPDGGVSPSFCFA